MTPMAAFPIVSTREPDDMPRKLVELNTPIEKRSRL
jgi:hypothetical protein